MKPHPSPIHKFRERLTFQDDIGQAFVDFFSHQFQSEAHEFPEDLMGLIPPSIGEEVNTAMISIPTEVEVRKAVFSIQGAKSPGPDGMSPTFYKNLWGIDAFRLVC